MYYQVIPTKIFRQTTDPSESLLTYSSPDKLTPGQIVLIPLGKAITPGIIYKSTTPPENLPYKIKSIHTPLDLPPLPSHLLKSALWLSQYYLSPLPAIANLLLPKGLIKNRRKISEKKINTNFVQLPQDIPLNQAQKTALENLQKIKSHTKLLHGITGSGKTNLYLTLAMEQFKKSHSSIILVPEISLTSQLVQEFQRFFPDSVITIHSKQTEASRHQTWQKIISSSQPLIIIGARSAIFSPLQNLGLIIIDEAHDPAYYQENPPRYSALRLASFIANTKNIDCIYGTATPLIEDYYLAEKNHAYVSLTKRAKETAFTPKIELIDLKNSNSFTKKA